MSKIQSGNSSPIKIVTKSFAFITVGVFLLNLILVGFGFADFLEHKTNKSLYILGLFIVQELILLAPVLFYLKKEKLDLGFKKQKPLTITKYVIGGMIGFIAINALIIYISTQYNITIPGYEDQDMRLPLFGEGKLSLIIAGLVLVLLAPMTEELLFRGLIFTQLRKKFSTKTTIVASAAIFAGFHLEFQVFIPLFILGCIIGYIYDRTETLWAPIAFHVLNNLLAYAEEVYSLSKTIS